MVSKHTPEQWVQENSRLKEEVRRLQERRDRIYDDMLMWRGIDREGGDTPCTSCGGSGVRTYGGTSTWCGGYGGQMMTADICDKCWGSGNANRSWTDLRKLLKSKQKMVPSDLRVIISERDRLREEKAELIEALEGLMGPAIFGLQTDKEILCDWGALGMSHITRARAALAKAKGETE